ncbi:putative transporter [Cryptosporidium canis]|uniref:Transporter n=1 Tax=Cryptosporidium canis TaxID=195482 RepID=A0A9D5HVY3_9CRYT|nr:putative transporter [Cryptosporidium canis]
MSIELKRASSRNEGDLESNTNETKESTSFINSLKSGSMKSSSLNSAMITSSSGPSHANARVVEVPLKESAVWIQMLIGFVTVVKATVGTGILFAPYAIVKSGYGVSIALILVYWLLNVVCTILMFQCADEANDTYSGIASVALGRPGRILADVSITFTQLSFCAVFATFVTKAIQNVISGIYNCAPGPYNGVHVLCTGACVGHLEQHSGQDLTVHKSGINRRIRWDCSIPVGIWSGGNILLRLNCGLQHPEELLLGVHHCNKLCLRADHVLHLCCSLWLWRKHLFCRHS